MKQNLVVLIIISMFLIALSILSSPNNVDAQSSGQPYAQTAANHLSGYLGRTITLSANPWEWQENVWNTPAMGCPDPNQSYPQESTRGYEIKIFVDAVEYLYYVSSDRLRITLCINNLPDPSSLVIIPTATPPPPEATVPPQATATLPATPTPTVMPGYPEVMSDPNWEIQTIVLEDVTMVLAPAGCFMMGSNEGDSDEQPVHEICFREPFWLDQTEVTRAMYTACIDAGICSETLASDYSFRETQPINRLNWFQARDYCEWRGSRLSTEAEWEYGARGSQNLVYPWGNEFDANNAIFANNAQGLTADVGSLPAGASWIGALDMSGNVWEWTNTLYLARNYPYPYDATDGREDPDNTEWARVIRGGSLFIDDALQLRSSYRNIFDPTDGTDGSIGVRCARDFTLEDLAAEPIQSCNTTAPSRLRPGDVGLVDESGDTANLNIRNLPTVSGSEVTGQIPVLTEFQVLEGPVCDENDNAWYRIHVPSDDQEGWVIEALGEGYTIRPSLSPNQESTPTS